MCSRRFRKTPLKKTTTRISHIEMCSRGQNGTGEAHMATLPHLNAFICERLTAAAVEIFGAVEKTLTDYQEEISRSKREIHHLRTLLLWPEVRLHDYRSGVGSGAHQVLLSCEEEASPERCHEEERVPDVSLRTLDIKEHHDQRADGRAPSCRQQGDTTGSPHRISAAEQTTDIKAEPGGDEEAEIPCGINPESSGFQRETLNDRPEIAHHERDGLDEQQYTTQDWSLGQDHGGPQIKAENLTSSSSRDYEPPLPSESRVREALRSSSPDHTLTSKTFYTAEVRKGCRLTRASHTFYPVHPNEYDEENAEGVLNGERIEELTPAGTRQKKKNDSNLRSKKRDATGVQDDYTGGRRHSCPICAKRFKELCHLKDHVRIHTGEKPYQCQECGVNFRQRGTLTVHTRIHTEERPHLCTVCGKSFKLKGNLKSHLKIHAGDNIQPL